MGRLFDYDNKVMQVLGKVADIIIISILWIVLSLTVIGFGPACTAAYYTTAKCVRRDRGSVFKEFWRALKSNFWRSVLLGILAVFFAASLFFFDFAQIANAVLNQETMGAWGIVFSAVKFFLFFGLVLYMFPILSRFQARIVKVVFSSLLVMFRYIGSTILMIFILLVVVITCIVYPYVTIFMPGIVFFLISFPLERILLRLVAEEDLQEDEEKDQWYLE